MPFGDFFRTRMGATFFEATVPRIAKALETIATALSTLSMEPTLNQLAKVKPHLGHIQLWEVAQYGETNSVTVECIQCKEVIAEIYNSDWEKEANDR